MARYKSLVNFTNRVSRREFLRQSGMVVAGASLANLPRSGLSLNSASQSARDPILEKINQAIDAYMTKYTPVGLAAAIIRPGLNAATPDVQMFFRGEVETNSGQVPDEKTIFELGSITKIFTSSLLADLVVNQKAIRLDDTVQQYYDKLLPNTVTLPTFEGQPMKVWHLATHTAALPREPANLKDGGPCAYSTELMYKALETVTLPQAPGKVALYSNLGFGILADVLCLISGQRPYEDVIQEFLTNAQLDMPDTHIMTAGFGDARFAQGYSLNRSSGTVRQADQCMPTWPALDGAGGLHSTLTDMIEWLKFNLGLINSPLSDVPAETVKPLHAFTATEKIGLGWQLRPLKAKPGTYTVTKDGATLGFTTDIVFYSPTQTAAIALTNTASTNPTALDAQLIEILNGGG